MSLTSQNAPEQDTAAPGGSVSKRTYDTFASPCCGPWPVSAGEQMRLRYTAGAKRATIDDILPAPYEYHVCA